MCAARGPWVRRLAIVACALTALLFAYGAFSVDLHALGLDRVARLRAAGTIDTILWGATFACVAVLAGLLREARALRQTGWRCGRFLYRFGWIDATPRSVVFVPGADLDVEVDVSDRLASGLREIRPRLSAGEWRDTLVVFGREEHVLEGIRLHSAASRLGSGGAGPLRGVRP